MGSTELQTGVLSLTHSCHGNHTYSNTLVGGHQVEYRQLQVLITAYENYHVPKWRALSRTCLN